jgi:hypothetical protein
MLDIRRQMSWGFLQPIDQWSNLWSARVRYQQPNDGQRSFYFIVWDRKITSDGQRWGTLCIGTASLFGIERSQAWLERCWTDMACLKGLSDGKQWWMGVWGGCLFSERAPRASGFGQHSVSDPLHVKMDNDDPVAVEWENMKTWVPRAEKDFWQCVHSHMCSLSGHMCSLSVCCLKKILHIFLFFEIFELIDIILMHSFLYEQFMWIIFSNYTICT